MQRTGDTIAPSALSCFIALSTSLRSRPLSSAILPAFRGWPASFIVANTFSFVSIIVRFFVGDIFVLLLSGKTTGVRNCRLIGHPLLFCLLYSRQIDRTAMILCQRASLTVVFLLRTSAIFKQVWLRFTLSRLGIIQASIGCHLASSRLGNIQTSLILLSAWRRLASALAAPEFDIALGLSSVWLLPIWLYRKRRVASTRNVGKKQRFCPSVRHKPCEVGARTGRNVVRRGRLRRKCQSSLATWRMMPWRVVEMKSVISSISGSGAICS